MKVFIGLVLLLCGGLAFAQAPETVDQIAPYLPGFMDDMIKGNAPGILGFVLMVTMAIIRQYVLPTAKINRDHLPFIIALMGGLSMAGMSMVEGSVPVIEALKNGLIGAFVAAGLWDLLGKYIAKLIFGDSYKVPAAPVK